MPVYHFHLNTDHGTIRDPDGMEFLDQEAAREHARQVARELMRNRERSTRSWQLEICDAEERSCFDLVFVSVEDSLSLFAPELRSSIERMHARAADLRRAMASTRSSLLHLKATMAQSEGRPYLAAEDGFAAVSLPSAPRPDPERAPHLRLVDP
jgi:hypothetical protein